MLPNSDLIFQKGFERRTNATLQWLEKSIEATHYQGSAAYYHLWKGWAPAYPETTGYIIETLFDYASHFDSNLYENLALGCADWLCSIQYSDGSFPGGVGNSGSPVVFDTGQILFGLTRAFQETGNSKYKTALQKAVDWLMEILESNRNWQQYTYVSGYVPTYYTRVVWAVLQANQVLMLAGINEKMQETLELYRSKVTAVQSVQDWGFERGQPAYTHTIAYTMRGFLESGHLLKYASFIQTAARIADKIITSYQSKGKLAGRYEEHWQGDYSFVCVTGNAQISLVLSRLYELTNKEIYRDYAIKIFEHTFSYQWLIPFSGYYGAVPGSAPLWGPYQRFRFPNWAAKFYLDAYLQLYKMEYE